MSFVVLAAALHVPDGGYDEDEDCLNAEDEEYRKAIEKMTKEERVKRQLFIDGELVDGEEDEEDDMQFTSPIENMDMNKYFIESMTSLSARNPHLAASLQSTLSPEELTLLQTIAETAK